MGACCSNEPAPESEEKFAVGEGAAEKFQVGKSPRGEEDVESKDTTVGTALQGGGGGESISPGRESQSLSARSIEGAEGERALTFAPEPIKDRRKSMRAPPEYGDGAYLTYAMTNDGSFYCVWRHDKPEEALIYARPKEGVRIPPFKYKGRTEIARSIHRSKKGPLEGLLQFLRTVRVFQCSFSLIDAHDEGLARVPQMIILLHLKDNQMDLVEGNSSFYDLMDVDSAAAILINTTGEEDMRRFVEQGTATLAQLQARCKQNSEHVELLSLAGLEI